MKGSERIIFRTLAASCTLLFSFVGLMALAPVSSAQSDRTSELRQNIANREEEIKKLEQEIADYQYRLERVGAQKSTLQTAVQTLDLTRSKLSKDIQLTQKKIERTNAQIMSLGRDMDNQEKRIERNREAIREIIHRIDQSDSDTMLEIFLSNDSFSSFLQEVDELERLQASISDNIKTIERLKNELSTSRSESQQEEKKLRALNAQLSDQKLIADNKRKEQSVLLATTKNQESSYKKILSESQARKKQFEREVDEYEAQLRSTIDPNSFPKPGTKVFAYPLDNVVFTQHFGRTSDAKRLYVSGTHNGIDLRAANGTPVKAAADGVVTATGDTDTVCRGASYGKWVLITHRNGLSTLYAHLDLIKAREGQIVNMGDLIGYSGTTGYATGPHLHFTVYVTSALEVDRLPSKSCVGAVFRIPVAPANAYLDPEAYL